MKNFGLHLDSRFCSFVIYYVYYVGYHFFDTSSQTFSKRILKKKWSKSIKCQKSRKKWKHQA